MVSERNVTPAGEDLWVRTFAERWRDIAREHGMKACVPEACVRDKWRRKRILECRHLCDDIGVWAAGFHALAENPWNLGDNPRGWKADLAYILRDQNRASIMELGMAFQDEVEARRQRERLEAERQAKEAKDMERGEW